MRHSHGWLVPVCALALALTGTSHTGAVQSEGAGSVLSWTFSVVDHQLAPACQGSPLANISVTPIGAGAGPDGSVVAGWLEWNCHGSPTIRIARGIGGVWTT